MSAETHRVLIGACGWKHSSWNEAFYSDDLPEDWQLGFYSNEFPVVYVPAKDWINVEDFAEWQEGVSEIFRFILEVPEKVLVDEQGFLAALKKAKSLNELCLGFVFKLSERTFTDIALFKKQLDMAQDIAPVCVDKGGLTLTNEVETILTAHNVSEVWDGQSPEHENLGRGVLAVSRVSSDGLDMKGLRYVIEGCLSASNDGCASVLCLEGKPPSLELLRNADILLNLL